MRIHLSRSWWLPNYTAITLPPFGIFISREADYAPTLRHELIHWEQYERYGFLKFYWLYLVWWVEYGYWNHPMEKEARERSL